MGKLTPAFVEALSQFGELGHGDVITGKYSWVHAQFSGTFTMYARYMAESTGINMLSVVDELFASSEPLVIADIGCGRGDLLRELKSMYTQDIYTLGFDVVRLPSHEHIDEIIIGDFELDDLSLQLQGHCNLILSDQVFRYFDNPLGRPLEKVRDMLSRNGRAFIDYSRSHCNIPPQLQDLVRNGSDEFTYKLLENGTLVMRRN